MTTIDSNPEPKPTLPPLTKLERKREQFWFRRISTILSIANAGGMVAIGGFVSNNRNFESATPHVIRAMTYFGIGAALIFISQFLVYLMCAFRIEEGVKWLSSVEKWTEKHSKKYGLGDQLLRIFLVIFMLFIVIVQPVVVFGSIGCLLMGGRAIVSDMATSACASKNAAEFCTTARAWGIFE